MKVRFLKWGFFVVLLPLLPLVVLIFNLLLRDKFVDSPTVLGGGELYMISGSIGATALGDMILFSGKRHIEWKYFFGVVCLSVVAITSALYSSVAMSAIMEQSYNKNLVVVSSGVMFVVTVIVSGVCVAFKGAK